MSRRLLLLRHAKSDWPAGVPDHQRPLAERGRREAPLAGRWLVERRLVPDLALVSSAVRTQQTWDLVRAELDADVPALVEDDLYGAGVVGMLDRLHALDDALGTVLLVGHNPGTESLAVFLDDGTGPADDRSRMVGKYPTSAIAVLGLTVDRWADVDRDTARLEAFAVPR